MTTAGQKTKTISISSGKGGVGKTTMIANLAYSLAMKGRRVLIFDGDLGLANVDILFGVKCEFNLMDVLKGDKEIDQIIAVARQWRESFVACGVSAQDLGYIAPAILPECFFFESPPGE